jgi:hypothetical protein
VHGQTSGRDSNSWQNLRPCSFETSQFLPRYTRLEEKIDRLDEKVERLDVKMDTGFERIEHKLDRLIDTRRPPRTRKPRR